jgi:hypothetical protein
MSRGSTLREADGTVIDLSGVMFTATGISDGVETPVGFGGYFRATTRYDFGELGSFTTDEWGDQYFQSVSDAGVRTIGLVRFTPGFFGGLDVLGFHVFIAPIPIADPLTTAPLGQVDILRTFGAGGARATSNAAGQVFRIAAFVQDPSTMISITSARVEAWSVREPTIALLLIVGLCSVRLGRRLWP